MENSELQSKWPAIKEKIKEQYPHLTEEQLKYEIGKEGELLEQLQRSLGKNKKDVDNWLSLMG